MGKVDTNVHTVLVYNILGSASRKAFLCRRILGNLGIVAATRWVAESHRCPVSACSDHQQISPLFFPLVHLNIHNVFTYIYWPQHRIRPFCLKSVVEVYTWLHMPHRVLFFSSSRVFLQWSPVFGRCWSEPRSLWWQAPDLPFLAGCSGAPLLSQTVCYVAVCEKDKEC